MRPVWYLRTPRSLVSPARRRAYPWLMLGFVVSWCAAFSAPSAPAIQVDEGPVNNEPTHWPVALAAAEGRIEMYQPQPEAMKGDLLTARAAVSLTRGEAAPEGAAGGAGAAAPVFGAAWFTAHVAIDRDTRTATLRQVSVKDVRLPGSTPAEQQEFARLIGGALSAAEVTFPLDHLTTSLDTAQREQIEATHIATTPPHIVFSTVPATLISVNGPARLEPVNGQPGASRVANTPFILLVDDASHHYFLKAGTRWVSAPELAGPWADASSVPPAIAAAGASLSIPETPPQPGAPAPADGAVPGSAPPAPRGAEISPAAADARIIIATEPTELVVTTGNPQFTPVAGGAGQLLYAGNTESDLFLDQAAQRYYVLLSGRWYAASGFQGPWQYVASDHLPPAFAQIPDDSPRADVLAFVAGTAEAREAVLDASIPQTASIGRDAGADLTVAYDGSPRFQDVPESPGVAFALNTPEDVLRVADRYYCCHQAVWYESAAAAGPWTVCTSVPESIYTLPPSCPAYHVRYVNVYDSSADDVTCGYLPGYTGTFVYGPTIVYGTGFTYPGWFGSVYFPPPCTWGFGAYYDPFVSAWGFDAGLYWGGIGWFGHPWSQGWWRDHPAQRWGWQRWWGPGGFAHSHELRSHFMEARSGGAIRVGERGFGPAARLPGTVHGAIGWNNLYAREGNAHRNFAATRPRTLPPARAVTGPRDNVFVGSDGRVFRRSTTGWQQHSGGGGTWSGVPRIPEAQPTYRAAPNVTRPGGSFARPGAGLEQHSAARARGAYRSGAIHSFNRGPAGGGGFRGGGAPRGGGGSRGGGGHR